MINWKKEGYTVGEEVLLVSIFYFTDRSNEHIGKVNYVGTKKLIVELDGKKISFNQGSRRSESNGFGVYYFVYKNKAERDNLLAQVKRKDELKELISEEIKNLSLNSLEKVYNIILEEKNC